MSVRSNIFEGGPDSIATMLQATAYSSDIVDQASVVGATAQVMNQLGCGDVMRTLADNGALDAIGELLLLRAFDSPLGNTILHKAAYSDVLRRPELGKRPQTIVDPVDAHAAMDSAFIARQPYDYPVRKADRRGATLNFSFNNSFRLLQLQNAMPYLARTRVVTVGAGIAALMGLWGANLFGIGTSQGATNVITDNPIGGIWSDPKLPGVSGGSKNNPAAFSLEGPHSYESHSLPGSTDLIRGSGLRITEWAQRIACSAGLSAVDGYCGNLRLTNGRVVRCSPNDNYSYNVEWVDLDGNTRTTEADIVLAGLGLQNPSEFITDRIQMIDNSGSLLVFDPSTKGKPVESYRSANNDVRIKVHRWQESLSSGQRSKMIHNVGIVLIFGIGNSAIEMAQQFEEDNIPYLIITDNPQRVVDYPTKTHNLGHRTKRLARNTDPYEFDLQNGVAYDLNGAKEILQYSIDRIVTGVQGVRWLPGKDTGTVVAKIYFGDGRNQVSVIAQEDVYGLYGYGIDTAAAQNLGMVVTESGKVLTDACGQVKAADGTTQVGYFTSGGHIAGGANKGIIPGMMNMLYGQSFAAIAQAARREMARQAGLTP